MTGLDGRGMCSAPVCHGLFRDARMIKGLAGVAIAVLFAWPAAAKTISLPDNNPVMTAFLPDSWKPSSTDTGFEAESPDEDVYVSVEYAKNGKQDFAAIMLADGMWTKESKIVPRTKTRNDRDLTLNGLAAHEIMYDARDKNGATNVIYTIYDLPNGGLAIVTIWGSSKERAGHDDQIQRVLSSVKPSN